jgi:hypothetical protein
MERAYHFFGGIGIEGNYKNQMMILGSKCLYCG